MSRVSATIAFATVVLIGCTTNTSNSTGAAISPVLSTTSTVTTQVPTSTTPTTTALAPLTTTTAPSTTTTEAAPTTIPTPTTDAAPITVAEIEDRIHEEWPGTVPAGMWADPLGWSCRQVTSGALDLGSVVECVPAITSGDQIPVLTVLVLDSAGTATIGQSGVVHEVLNPEAIVPILGPDGFCRDILADGSALTGLPTAEMEYFGAVLYWFMEGMPERMDADRNAVPCETLFDASVVSSVWGGGWVEDMGTPLAEALVGTWEGIAVVPSAWVEIGSVWFEFRSDGKYSVRHDGEVSGGLYWGDDIDSPLRTYAVFGPAPGHGWITMVWERFVASTGTGRLENIMVGDDWLHFELWNDGGRRPPNGPVIYDLVRAEAGYCVNDPYEGNDTTPTNHGSPVAADQPPATPSFDGVLCPSDVDLHFFGVHWYSKADCPVGTSIEVALTVTVTSTNPDGYPLDAALLNITSYPMEWRETSSLVGATTVPPGGTASIEHVWSGLCDAEIHPPDSWVIEILSPSDRRETYTVDVTLDEPVLSP